MRHAISGSHAERPRRVPPPRFSSQFTVCNHFGVGFRNEGIATRFNASRSGSWFSMMPLCTTTMCSETWMRVILKLFTVRRPASVSNGAVPGAEDKIFPLPEPASGLYRGDAGGSYDPLHPPLCQTGRVISGIPDDVKPFEKLQLITLRDSANNSTHSFISDMVLRHALSLTCPSLRAPRSLVESGVIFYKYCPWSGGLFYPHFRFADGADAYPALQNHFSFTGRRQPCLCTCGTRLNTSSLSATLR